MIDDTLPGPEVTETYIDSDWIEYYCPGCDAEWVWMDYRPDHFTPGGKVAYVRTITCERCGWQD